MGGYEPEEAGEECFAAAELSFGAMVRRRNRKCPKLLLYSCCRGFVDRSSKSSLERKINHERVHLQLQLDSSGGAYPFPIKAEPSAVSQHPAKTSGDSVKLSQAAQVHLFKQQGQSPSQIAANLGISAATVDGYLGIAVSKAPAAPAAGRPSAPSPEPVEAHAQTPPQATPVAVK